MAHTNLQGTITFGTWDTQKGYHEAERPFASLDELFHICLQMSDSQPGDPDSMRIDRISLRGSNEEGDERTVIFSFQSVSAGDGTQLV